MHNNERGGATVNILLAIMLIVIGVLIYILASGTPGRLGRSIGTDSPRMTPPAGQTPPSPNPGVRTNGEFSDGLGRPESSVQYQLDEFGAGVARRDVFRRDINGDGALDRITRVRVENGTPHFYDEYKIELNQSGKFIDITPDDWRTIEGADCALQKLQFKFSPTFQVVKIGRPWQESWETPTRAVKTTYSLATDKIEVIKTETLKTICDVSALF